MQFLSPPECVEWCAERSFPARQIDGETLPSAVRDPDGFYFTRFRHPADSGRKVWLASYLFSLLKFEREALLWLGAWSVWPSSEHMPLVARLRQALGEQRPLIESPGHLVPNAEFDDAISLLAISFLFVWDCHVVGGSGRDAVFVSHDEYGWFGSREPAVAQGALRALQGANVECSA